METRYINVYQCPVCNWFVDIPDKVWGEATPPCPNCGANVWWWLQDGEYNANFRVAGGTGAQKQGRKKFGGHR